MTRAERDPEDTVLQGAVGPTVAPLLLEGPAEAEGPSGGEVQSTGGIGIQIVRVFAEHKLAIVSLAFIILMVLFCWLGPVFYHTDQTNQANVLLNPENSAPGVTGFTLGTDNTGFDVLGRLMYGGQTSLTVGLLSALVATIVGVIYGAIAGFLGRWLDALLMRIVDIVLSMPVLFLLIALVTIFHSSELLLIFVIAGVSWLIPARLVRGGRRKTLKIAATWPWAGAVITAWKRIQALPHPT